MPTEDIMLFFLGRNYVLQMTDAVGNPGSVRWEILLCLIAAWVVVYFCMWKGVKSSGKVRCLHVIQQFMSGCT